MLSLLHIENIAVIECVDIAFETGLTVLTGETGAGKSIIIDAIGAIMGQRIGRDLVRAGADKGFVSATFTNIPSELSLFLKENQLEGDEGDILHIQRQISADGRAVCRVNLKPAPASALKQISPYLINVHGQHDGQKLMDDSFHIDFLDCFAGIEDRLNDYKPLYQQLLSLKRRITELDKSEQERLQRLDMLTFHLSEIDAAQLVKGEEENLVERKAFFDNAGRIAAALNQAHFALDGEGEVLGAYGLLCSVSDTLAKLADVSEVLRSLAERAEELKYLSLDLRDAVAQQQGQIEFSPDEQAQVEYRLDTIYRMKQKYGASIEAVLSYAQHARAEAEALQSADERREVLLSEYRSVRTKAREAANQLTAQRRRAAAALEKRIVSELSSLDMTKVRFSVRVESYNKLAPKGVDAVSFLISVNPGEPLRPLSKVASGGELSRIMLAIKNVLTEQEPVGTLIFDEIDTGVSGMAAQKIAHKLFSIGCKKQTLCVTHLPQIAAIGANHMLIKKSVKGNRTYTTVQAIAKEERTDEIARMISGDRVTDASRKNAQELMNGRDAAERQGEK